MVTGKQRSPITSHRELRICSRAVDMVTVTEQVEEVTEQVEEVTEQMDTVTEQVEEVTE